MRLRSLTSLGMEEFRKYLRSGPTTKNPPMEILTSLTYSQEVTPSVEIAYGDSAAKSESKYELARNLCEALGDLVDKPANESAGMWTALALIYFDLICPVVNGERVIREDSKYILTGDWKTHYRHLVATPCWLYKQFGDDVSCLLHGPPHVWGDVLEQVASRRIFLRSGHSVIRLIGRLYFDPRTRHVKKGATDRERPGSLRRLADVLQQLDLTYDLQTLGVDELQQLLPSAEFAQWSN